MDYPKYAPPLRICFVKTFIDKNTKEYLEEDYDDLIIYLDNSHIRCILNFPNCQDHMSSLEHFSEINPKAKEKVLKKVSESIIQKVKMNYKYNKYINIFDEFYGDIKIENMIELVLQKCNTYFWCGCCVHSPSTSELSKHSKIKIYSGEIVILLDQENIIFVPNCCANPLWIKKSYLTKCL